ncbi:MAG: potassium/proton antiporter [Armatimonadetes bacterium]|nr:potassium/proton antiporter [Armatimonadota bacterium]
MWLEAWLVGLGIMLIFSIVGSKLASTLNIPVLLFFLAIGMAVGSDGPGGVWFSDTHLAKDFGALALAFILFSGGMDLDWKASAPYVWKAGTLSSAGVVISTGVVALAAWKFLGYTPTQGILLGAIISSTDAAAVFSSLSRGKRKLRKDLTSILEMESGSNDPMAIFVTISVVFLLAGNSTSVWGALGSFVWQMFSGALGGWALGRLGVFAMRKLRLDYEGMFHGLSLALVMLAFGGISMIGGNGFLAVYVAGVVFGNGEFRQRKGLRRFHDGVAWLMQIFMFIVLGLLVFPHQMAGLIWQGVAISAVLMLVARPLAVFLSLSPFRVPLKEQVFVSWAGLRGAVPIVLATYPFLEKLPRANEYFHLVFFVVIFSVLLQGTTIGALAQALGLYEEAPPAAPLVQPEASV